MKYEEFGVKTLFGALKHQWKFIVVVVLVFALVGIGAGFAFADQGAGEAAGEAEALPTVDTSALKMNSNYYNAYFQLLRNNYNTAVAYQKDFVSKNNLTAQQKQDMTDVLLELEDYYNDTLNIIEKKFNVVGAVYIPADFYEQYVEACEQGLEISRNKLEVAQIAAEMLATMDAPISQTDETLKNYDLILSTAASGLEQMQLVQIYEARLETLTDKDAVVKAEAEMQQLLTDATAKWNALLTTLNKKANAIAKETNVIFNILPGEKDTVEFTLRHTHDTSSVQESFVLIVLFCVLTGICVSLFFAIYRESKSQKKSQAA